MYFEALRFAPWYFIWNKKEAVLPLSQEGAQDCDRTPASGFTRPPA